MTATVEDRTPDFIDRVNSTITLDGKTFPACMLICPEDDTHDGERQRTIGNGGLDLDTSVYVPTENGLLFEVDWPPVSSPPFGLSIICRRCERHEDPNALDEWMWLPKAMALGTGSAAVIPAHRPRLADIGRGGPHAAIWQGCDEDWIAETIYRLGHAPTILPDEGPEVRLVRLDYFDA